jgi:hypothetical protein
MADATSEFFERLAQRGHEPGFGRTTGSIRFDLVRDGATEPWRVDLRRGAVAVARSADDADCVVHADASLFDDLVSGRANALASLLRGRVQVEGELTLLVRFQRLFPAPTGRKKASSSRTVGKRRS